MNTTASNRSTPHITNVLSDVANTLSQRLFFVVGCQKTGTTWVQKLLDGHPNACCKGEAYFAPLLVPMFKQVIEAYNTKHKAGTDGPYNQEDFKHLVASTIGLKFTQWRKQKQQQTGQPITSITAIGEKTPEHACCLPQLDAILGPNHIRVIHVVRDPRDVVVSGWHHNLKQKGQAFLKQFPEYQTYAAYTIKNHWLAYVQQAEQWGQANPDRFIRLRYEDLHQNLEQALSPALNLLDLPALPALPTESLVQNTSIPTGTPNQTPLKANHSAADPNITQTSGSFFRKGQVGDYKQDLPPAVADWISQTCQSWMQTLGYD